MKKISIPKSGSEVALCRDSGLSVTSRKAAKKAFTWLNGGGSKSLKICLATFAVMSATSSFAVPPIEIGATALNSGGYEMALVRKLSDGGGLGLVAGQAAEQKYFGAHLPMIKVSAHVFFLTGGRVEPFNPPALAGEDGGIPALHIDYS